MTEVGGKKRGDRAFPRPHIPSSPPAELSGHEWRLRESVQLNTDLPSPIFSSLLPRPALRASPGPSRSLPTQLLSMSSSTSSPLNLLNPLVTSPFLSLSPSLQPLALLAPLTPSHSTSIEISCPQPHFALLSSLPPSSSPFLATTLAPLVITSVPAEANYIHFARVPSTRVSRPLCVSYLPF